MGIYLFKLPDVGEGVIEAEIVAWHVKPGDVISEDDMLADVMTDKATVEMTSPVDGIVKSINGDIGDLIPVGSVLVEMRIEGDGEETQSSSNEKAPEAAKDVHLVKKTQSEKTPEKSPPIPHKRSVKPRSSMPLALGTRSSGEAPLAAPATRKRAFELGIPLQFIAGTGPGELITEVDLDTYIAQGSEHQIPQFNSLYAKRTQVNQTKIVGLRRKIATKMQDAKSRIPHFTYIEEFDLTALQLLRKDMNEGRKHGQPKLTLLPYFMRAFVQLQPEFPSINATYDDQENTLNSFEAIHIGIATQTPGGLMVPVVKHVETLDIWDCATELGRVTNIARSGKANRDELSGSTITLTSLGKLGGTSATPVINSPEVAIIGPNKLVERPVVIDGKITIRTLMNVSSSFDHRIVDGYDAARFIQRLKRLIEQPAYLFMEPS